MFKPLSVGFSVTHSPKHLNRYRAKTGREKKREGYRGQETGGLDLEEVFFLEKRRKLRTMGRRGTGGWCLKRESAMAHEIKSTVKKGRVLILFSYTLSLDPVFSI